jgi:hypothetical protein|nr:MAG TPA: hypothetical protein [Caudoviricetes sp.]DAU09255.1 MAG TPA: hypothetical protein [Caudoviricetes sp.]
MGKKADNALLFRRVLSASGLSDIDVNRKSRKHDIVMNRALVCCVMRDMGLSMSEISDFLCIDRSTIYNLLKYTSELDEKVKYVKGKMKEER